MWERLDAEHNNYQIEEEKSFQNRIRTYPHDYFQVLTNISDITRQGMISHTLLIDDDILNVQLAQGAGYMAYKVKETGFEMEDWERIVAMVEKQGNSVDFTSNLSDKEHSEDSK